MQDTTKCLPVTTLRANKISTNFLFISGVAWKLTPAMFNKEFQLSHWIDKQAQKQRGIETLWFPNTKMELTKQIKKIDRILPKFICQNDVTLEITSEPHQ